MKMKSRLLCLLVCVLSAGPVLAGADDTKWINQCIKDNKDEGAKAEVVKTYCECMNSKMDDNETKTITQWEKTHPDERKACEKKAGWK